MIRLPVECNFIDEKDLEYLPPIEMKYKWMLNEDQLLFTADILPVCIRNVIVTMNNYALDYFDSYDRCYLDVKVRDLKEGESGDHLNQIHLDWTNDFNHPNKHETHFLYTNTGGTKFYSYDEFVGETLPQSIYKYHREYHQSPRVKSACKRVMIRLSFVDTLN